jgi:hypothetical protein
MRVLLHSIVCVVPYVYIPYGGPRKVGTAVTFCVRGLREHAAVHFGGEVRSLARLKRGLPGEKEVQLEQVAAPYSYIF